MAEKDLRSNVFTNGVAEVVLKTDIQTLEETMRHFDKPSYAYSLLVQKDESVCMISENGYWDVYYFQKGQQTDKESFDTLSDACIKMICKFADSDQEEVEMLKYYMNKKENAR